MMKKQCVRFLSIIFCLSVLLSASTAVHADDSGTCGDNLTWTLEGGTLTIRGEGEMENYFYETPWYSQREKIQEVVIENGVTSIGDFAFDGCTSLTMITIPNSVTSIEWGTFGGCTSLTTITIPDSVTSIGDFAFNGCASLTEIIIPDSVTSIEWGAFQDCSSLTTITIPDSITSIVGNAFYGCISLQDVYYLGTAEECESQITVYWNNECLMNATWHYAEVWICGSCGKADNRGNFCPNCGARKPGIWVCISCGQEDNTGNYCTNCGSPRP